LFTDLHGALTDLHIAVQNPDDRPTIQVLLKTPILAALGKYVELFKLFIQLYNCYLTWFSIFLFIILQRDGQKSVVVERVYKKSKVMLFVM
jgi:hypothetical protein